MESDAGRGRRWLLLGLTAVFFAVQFAHTVRDVNHWPFCSYNMFNFHFPLRARWWKVELYDERGHRTTADVGQVLPLEFFRTRGLLQRVFVDGRDVRQQERLARYLLWRLNERPWTAFDETLAPAQPAPGQRFVAFRIVAQHVDFGEYRRHGRVTPTRVDVLYTYDRDRFAGTDRGEAAQGYQP